jgi:GDP-L-fucose synthase
MPTMPNGPGDNFELQNCHFLPALLRRFHVANHRSTAETVNSGSGALRREFPHGDDIRSAVVHLMRLYERKQILNVEYVTNVTILDLAELIA